MQDKPRPEKKQVKLMIRTELLENAKAAGLDLTVILEHALHHQLSTDRGRKWREENRKAIEASNLELEKNGHWSTPDWLAN